MHRRALNRGVRPRGASDQRHQLVDLVYLDNSVISAQGKREVTTELPAVEELFARHRGGTIRIVTSEVTQRELSNYISTHRASIERIYVDLQKVPLVETRIPVCLNSYWDKHGGWNSPMIGNDAIWDAICKAGLDTADAHHVMVAVRGRCDVFVTLDKATVLRHENALKSVVPIRVRLPSTYLAELAQGGT
jgi:predicted nucleic acid-binding protein